MDKIYRYHLNTNKKLYIFLLATFTIGLIAGSLSSTFLNNAQSSELNNFLNKYINQIHQGQYEIDKSSVSISNVYQGIIIAVCGLFTFGILFIFFLVGGKGFLMGFTINYALLNLGGKGWLLVLCSLIPPNLIIIPTIFFQSVIATRAILRRQEHKNIKRGFGNNKFYKEYTIFNLCALALLLFSGIVEVYISPLFFQLFLNIFY